ncbi:hypothetical protein FHX40_2291 [Thermopolyspora flexuosa]|uniref:Uncharacterized protein n=1 Tax=Thermopolyspora flexuosa TaxID=103836 RepID=A0A543IYC3_9ACTN|nr:hypothetical protein FHX40_2291 [Thermopolyspora flexuosa]
MVVFNADSFFDDVVAEREVVTGDTDLRIGRVYRR